MPCSKGSAAAEQDNVDIRERLKEKCAMQLEEVTKYLELEDELLVASAKQKLAEEDSNAIKNFHHIMSILELKIGKENISILKNTATLQRRMNSYTRVLIGVSLLMLVSSIAQLVAA